MSSYKICVILFLYIAFYIINSAKTGVRISACTTVNLAPFVNCLKILKMEMK